MQIKLISLTLKHFKRVQDYTLVLNGHDADIFGKNAAGKTTIFDAYVWVLFGIDSENTKNFTPKPYDSEGNDVHGLESSVTAEFAVDGGRRITLMRVMSEDWVKQRGQTERVFKGNTYSYFINEVPTTKTEYDNYVKSIVAQDVFKMITNAWAFNDLDWKKRRQMLMDISGADVDGLLLQKPEYARVVAAMEKRGLSLDDLRTATQAQRKKISDQLEKIPIQIAEVRRMDVGVDEAELSAAQSRREALLGEVRDIDGQLSDASGVLKRHEAAITGINQMKSECMAIERAMDGGRQREQFDVQSQILALDGIIQNAERNLGYEAQRLLRFKDERKTHIASADKLRAEWFQTNEQRFEAPSDANLCPHCGQGIPEADAQRVIDAARTGWQSRKQADMDRIKGKGCEEKKQAEACAQQITELEARMSGLQTTLDENREKLLKLQGALSISEALPPPTYDSNIRYAALKRQIEEQEKHLHQAGDGGLSAQLSAEKRSKMDEIARCDAVLSKKTQHERNQQRIEELNGALREQGQLLADTEQLLIQIEKFVTDRCRLLETSINEMFETVRWKLFEVQNNGGIVDACVCMVRGGGPGAPLVPYPGPNHAAKLNAGLEIIDVLGRYYGVFVPVMIDGGESFNDIRETDAQQIVLRVSLDPELIVHLKEKTKLEVA